MSRACKLSSTLVALIALMPIMLAHGQMFDSDGHSMFFLRQDPFFLEEIWAHGWYLMYASFLLFNKLSQITGIPPKFFFNLLGVVSIAGIAWETCRYLRLRFGMERGPACIAGMAVLAFPIWHVSLASFFISHLFCFWMFMLAVNLYRQNGFFAGFFLLLSLNLFSLFPFAVGIACVEFLMTADRKNWFRQGLRVMAFSVALVVWYAILTSLVSVHGVSGSYNAFAFRFESLGYFGIFSALFVTLWFGISRISTREESRRLLLILLSFLTLCFFAAFAYWAVDRPLLYFRFGSFTSRHTLLTCVPYALMVGVVCQYVYKRWGGRVMDAVAAFVLTVSVVLLYQGYDHKVAALLFKDMLTYSLEQIEAPPSGYVSIVAKGFKAPQHVHNYSVNKCFYKAYGKAAWMANGFWARRGFAYDEPSMRELYAVDDRSKKAILAFEVTGDVFTRYDFSLENFHQEGRLWYWYNYLAKDYSSFTPKLKKS